MTRRAPEQRRAGRPAPRGRGRAPWWTLRSARRFMYAQRWAALPGRDRAASWEKALASLRSDRLTSSGVGGGISATFAATFGANACRANPVGVRFRVLRRVFSPCVINSADSTPGGWESSRARPHEIGAVSLFYAASGDGGSTGQRRRLASNTITVPRPVPRATNSLQMGILRQS